jgi:hypothetical protein
MTRRNRLKVELLEVRTLLSGLIESLTTDRSVYEAGQPIQMTFTETNNGNQAVNVVEGPSVDGFNVEQNGVVVWQSNFGINPFVLVDRQLEPGQSLTLTAAWNGVGDAAGSPALTGTFTVVNQLDPHGASATFQIVSGESSGGGGSISPTPSPSPIAAELTTDRPAYRAGQKVHITLTLTNTSDHAVSIAPDSGPDGFTISDGSEVLWRTQRSSAPANSQTVLPGQSLSYKATWISRRSLRLPTKFAGGALSIQAAEGGYAASGTIELEQPVRRDNRERLASATTALPGAP